VLSHRLAQWSSRAPSLEEDVALTNIALDLLGQARALYMRTSELDGTGRSEDAHAFQRDERDFVNCLLVEQENGDFAVTVARQLLFSTYQLETWRALGGSTDRQVAAIAAKAVKEVTYHLDHATPWTPTGGRRGLHTECFGYMLAEMQHLHRAHPGARW